MTTHTRLNCQNRCIILQKQEDVSFQIYTKHPPQFFKIAAPHSKNKKLSAPKSTQNTRHNLSKSLHPTPKTSSCQHVSIQIYTKHPPQFLQKQVAVSIQICTKHPPQFVKTAAPYSKNKKLSASKSTQNSRHIY